MRKTIDDDDNLFLSRFSDMKRAMKKTDFEYRCYPCRRQEDKARLYTRSYDLILHMVNMHRKYPVDVKHNAYYAVDGSDLRDATEEEIVKYRLAAAHKCKKPDVELTGDRSKSTTVNAHEERRDNNSLYKGDANRRRGDSPRAGKKKTGKRVTGKPRGKVAARPVVTRGAIETQYIEITAKQTASDRREKESQRVVCPNLRRR